MEKWLFSVAAGKVVKRVASFAVSSLIAGVAGTNLSNLGVNVQVDPVVATGSVLAGVELLKNFIKVKFNLKWL